MKTAEAKKVRKGRKLRIVRPFQKDDWFGMVSSVKGLCGRVIGHGDGSFKLLIDAPETEYHGITYYVPYKMVEPLRAA